MASGVVPDRCPQCGGNLPPTDEERVTCAYCGSSLIRLKPPARRKRGTGEAGGAWGVRFRTINCVDGQGIGVEAFRMLIPADWQFEGGVRWVMNNPGAPAAIAFRAYNPQGKEAFEVFPNINCYWTNNPMITTMYPIGGLYFGNEVRPPMPALQALLELVVPRHRGQMPGLEVIQQEQLPNLAQQIRADIQSPVPQTQPSMSDGARVRLRYGEVEEDVFGVVELVQISMPMMMGMVEHIYWAAEYLMAFRAQAGQLDNLGDTFKAITRSFRLNPEWYSRYMQVSQYLIQNQIQQIQHVGQLSRIISQTSSQISDMMMASYNQRQQTMDRLAEQFSQAIRGVDEYYDPFKGQGVELPGGYNYAWSNALGEYIVTDDPNFNPNVGSNVNWEAMERR